MGSAPRQDAQHVAGASFQGPGDRGAHSSPRAGWGQDDFAGLPTDYRGKSAPCQIATPSSQAGSDVGPHKGYDPSETLGVMAPFPLLL